jgi:two-component system response regulator FlrC
LQAARDERAPVSSESNRILIVEPNAVERGEFARALLPAGFEPEAVPGLHEALERLSRGVCVAIVASAELPDGGAAELLAAAGRRAPALPVILISARGSVAAAVAAIRAGAYDYLLKPVAADTLAGAVRQALGAVAAARPPRHSTNQKTFLTRDPRLMEVLETARRVARSTATVLIQGESGTGKELLAAFVHRHGLHPDAPYVAVNCAALPDSLAESELFGHEKGAFTGAVMRKPGKFELARRGTLVLDEIGEMPLPLQAKLLRALQEREIDRVGGTAPVPVEARVVAVTNRDLAQMVGAGTFREDLFYRIQVMPLVIPPLRERPGDIALLADHFLAQFAARFGKPVRRFADEAVQRMARHEWRGNVRELENRVERAVLLADGETVGSRDLGWATAVEMRPAAAPAVMPPPTGTTVHEMERQLIMGTLSQVDQNRTRAAELLGISIRTLRNKLREYREAAPEAAQAAGR